MLCILFTYPYSIVNEREVAKTGGERNRGDCAHRWCARLAFEFERCGEIGGADRDRTDDPLLAKQVLSQLSYSPSVRIESPDRRIYRFANLKPQSGMVGRDGGPR